MKVSVLGSGSAGNAILVCSAGTRLLVDAGFSGRGLAERLRGVGIDPEEISAIVITHDHVDHTRGMGVFARRYGTALHITRATRAKCASLLQGDERIEEVRPGHPFRIGPLRIEPFATVHDAADPMGVAVIDEESGLKLGVATDLGRPNAQIRYALKGCDLLVLEANHDEVLLHSSRYPVAVRTRIASSHGHLSNQMAAQLAVDLAHPRLAGIVLAHLSEECNRPSLALEVVQDALRRRGWTGHIEVADQDRPMPLLDLQDLAHRRGPTQLDLL